VLIRLVEVLLIEVLRATPGENAPPGLSRSAFFDRFTRTVGVPPI